MESFDYKKYAWIVGTLALAGIFFATIAVGASYFKNMDRSNGQIPTISVSGEGEVMAIPDIATVTITVRESATTVPEAQKLAEAKVKAAIAALAGLGVEEKDQRTTSYTVNPKYENVAVYSAVYPGTVSNPKIVGYEVSQTIEIKVRNIDAAGQIIGALGSVNITEIYGPSFTVDDIERFRAEAKEKAINNAREKAIAIASALGVELGEVTAFYEDTGSYYGRDMVMNQSYGKGVGGMAPEVSLPVGENVITSRVTVTFNLD